MARAYISVNGHKIRSNSKNGTREPTIAVRIGKRGEPIYTSRVKINGPSELVYDPAHRILKCGARLVLVANADDVVVGGKR
jgi:hypothetical protein